jgi:hypothetical protein
MLEFETYKFISEIIALLTISSLSVVDIPSSLTISFLQLSCSLTINYQLPVTSLVPPYWPSSVFLSLLILAIDDQFFTLSLVPPC